MSCHVKSCQVVRLDLPPRRRVGVVPTHVERFKIHQLRARSLDLLADVSIHPPMHPITITAECAILLFQVQSNGFHEDKEIYEIYQKMGRTDASFCHKLSFMFSLPL